MYNSIDNNIPYMEHVGLFKRCFGLLTIYTGKRWTWQKSSHLAIVGLRLHFACTMKDYVNFFHVK